MAMLNNQRVKRMWLFFLSLHLPLFCLYFFSSFLFVSSVSFLFCVFSFFLLSLVSLFASCSCWCYSPLFSVDRFFVVPSLENKKQKYLIKIAYIYVYMVTCPYKMLLGRSWGVTRWPYNVYIYMYLMSSPSSQFPTSFRIIIWTWVASRLFAYWCLVGNGWEWGNGMILDSYSIVMYCGSFPYSLLSTSKLVNICKYPHIRWSNVHSALLHPDTQGPSWTH